MVPGPATAYLGQQRLLPGEYLHVRGGKQCKGRYWQLAFQEPGAARARASFAGNKQEFLRLLRLAVESSLGADGARHGRVSQRRHGQFHPGRHHGPGDGPARAHVFHRF